MLTFIIEVETNANVTDRNRAAVLLKLLNQFAQAVQPYGEVTRVQVSE